MTDGWNGQAVIAHMAFLTLSLSQARQIRRIPGDQPRGPPRRMDDRCGITATDRFVLDMMPGRWSHPSARLNHVSPFELERTVEGPQDTSQCDQPSRSHRTALPAHWRRRPQPTGGTP